MQFKATDKQTTSSPKYLQQTGCGEFSSEAG